MSHLTWVASSRSWKTRSVAVPPQDNRELSGYLPGSGTYEHVSPSPARSLGALGASCWDGGTGAGLLTPLLPPGLPGGLRGVPEGRRGVCCLSPQGPFTGLDRESPCEERHSQSVPWQHRAPTPLPGPWVGGGSTVGSACCVHAPPEQQGGRRGGPSLLPLEPSLGRKSPSWWPA